MDKLEIIKNDPWLEPFQEVILERYSRAGARERELLAGLSDLKEFASGHLYFGLHIEEDQWVFREWAPNATRIFLVGDFSGWSEKAEWELRHLGNGKWELKLPLHKLNHKDLFRLSIYWNGGRGDRIPAWISRVHQDPDTKIFNAQVWHPQNEYRWKNPHAAPLNSPPLVYESHIGMSSEEAKVSSYYEFRKNVLPRIVAEGYNTIQLMAIQEHPYYGSFGYHVSNFFAASSRFGPPEDLKELIDEAHGNGIAVIMDLVHSHAVKNEIEGLARFDGTAWQYFHGGQRREHVAWDSLCFNYGKTEVLHFLLSNCRYWLEEYRFDGYRFDGITSMLYYDHGLSRDFTSYEMYYDRQQDEDAIIYLLLANKLIKELHPLSITVAEEMSGMPGIGASLKSGGFGFDYRLAMGTPDYWIKIIKEKLDEDWNVEEIYHELTRSRDDELTIGYAESHDQALVGDKTIAFRLMDKEMYTGMSVSTQNLIISRGIALHKMIRLITLATAGGGYLNFMGNEYGHPEWIDFPREGNNWSHHYARRQWSLADETNLQYKYLGDFDRDMIRLIREESTLKVRWPYLNAAKTGDQVLMFERGSLVFVFNFNPSRSFTDYGFPVNPGKFRLVLNSDDTLYGGQGLVDASMIYYSMPERSTAPKHILKLYLPARSALVLEKTEIKKVH